MVEERRSKCRPLYCRRPTTRLRGWLRFRIPVIDMPIYLGYLLQRFTNAGGTLEMRRIQALDEAIALADTTINCVGLAARDLVDDTSMTPIRGQVVWVTNPGVERFVLDEAESRKSDLYHSTNQRCRTGWDCRRGCLGHDSKSGCSRRYSATVHHLEPRLSMPRSSGIVLAYGQGVLRFGWSVRRGRMAQRSSITMGMVARA